jgi:sirohydrochlorin ferrochelatase
MTVLRLTEGDEVDEKDLVRQRHELEVGELHNRPHHPVLGQRVEVCALQLLPRVGALEQRHGAQEAEQVGTSEHCLVGEDTRDDLKVGLARDDNLLLEEAEPLHGGRAEDAASVEDHAAGTAEVVVLESFLFDEMLGHAIASREEEASRDGLGEDWARGQLGLVPFGANVSEVRVYLCDELHTSATS